MTGPAIGPAHPDFGKSPVVAPSAPSTVTLPSVPEIHRWVERTRQERAALQARADRLREQFEPLRKQLAGIERSIKMLDQILAQVAIDGEATNGTAQARGSRPGARLPAGAWSRKHAACLMCGTAEKPHKAKGYCWDCYQRRKRPVAHEAVS